MSRHYDQVGGQSFRCLKNLDARVARHDFDFVAGFAIDFLARQPLKLGSRGSLHLIERQRHLRSRRYCNYVKQVENCFAFLRQFGGKPQSHERVRVELNRTENLFELKHLVPF